MSAKNIILLCTTLLSFVLASPLTAQNTKKRVMAVSEVQVDGTVQLLDYIAAPREVMRQEIEAAIVATRTFSVVTNRKNEIDAIMREAKNSQRKVRSLPVDFVVEPVIQALEFERRAKPIANLESKVRVRSSGEIRMRVRVLDVSTGELRAPFIVDVDWQGENEIRDRRPGDGGEERISSSDFVSMARKAGQVLANAILEQVYPVQVIARDGDEVWISRGADAGYAPGERLKIYSGDGEPLLHPITGEVLGTREKLLGIIEIADTRPKFSTGKIIEETGGTIGEGAIVRN